VKKAAEYKKIRTVAFMYAVSGTKQRGSNQFSG
jgi:hypothetical protein